MFVGIQIGQTVASKCLDCSEHRVEAELDSALNRQDLDESASKFLPIQTNLRNENLTNSWQSEASGRSIYSSLIKIIYQLKRQLERDRVANRWDQSQRVDVPESEPPKSGAKETSARRPKDLEEEHSSKVVVERAAGQPFNESATITLEVNGEPFGVQPVAVSDRFDSDRHQATSSTSSTTTRRPKTARKQTILAATFSPKLVGRYSAKLHPKDTTSRSSMSSIEDDEDEDERDLSQPLFSMTSSTASMGARKWRPNIEREKAVQVEGYQPYQKRYNKAATGGGLLWKDSASSNREPQLEQQVDGDEDQVRLQRVPSDTSDYSQPNMPIRQPKMNPYSIQLQQVHSPPNQPTYETPIQLQSGSSSYSQPQVRPAHLEAYRANTIGHMSSSSGQLATTSYESQPIAAVPASQQPRDLVNQPQTIQITAVPNGLNGLANNALIRINGLTQAVPGAFNNLWQNGLVGNGLLDPLGRPVLMVNAERRQVDWSFWIWPILAVVTLPLILGALFVPVFLKTVVVLIQILQSLGLLIPLANALGQQMVASVTSAAAATTTSQVDQHQTQKFNQIS